MITRISENLHIEWKKELADVITSPQALLEYLHLEDASLSDGFAARKLFPMRVPKFFASLMQKGDPNDPLLLQVLPLKAEFIQQPQYSADPLDEHNSALAGLLHKYQSRVLIMLKNGCAINCRYCFRRHFPYGENKVNRQQLAEIAHYLNQHKGINEVILSGGDPLMASDETIMHLLDLLEPIRHIKHFRIHTRMPVTMPSRLTPTLANMLRDSRLNSAIVLHINHPNEVSDLLLQRLTPYWQAGITLLNQSVLLKGVNDSAETLITLSHKLYGGHILPYYLHVLDKVQGAAHFDLDEARAIAIHNDMRAQLSGFLLPKLVREIGGEQSKTPIF